MHGRMDIGYFNPFCGFSVFMPQFVPQITSLHYPVMRVASKKVRETKIDF
jgi:hypothetical protein